MTAFTVLKGHEKDLGGGLLVCRYLPSADKQTIGPFNFFDHFCSLDVAPNPRQSPLGTQSAIPLSKRTLANSAY